MKKVKCEYCQDKKVVLVQRSGVSKYGDYYEPCKKCNERIEMPKVRRLVRPGLPKR